MKGDLWKSLDTPEIAVEEDRPKKTYVNGRELHYHGAAFLVLIAISLIALSLVIRQLPCTAEKPRGDEGKAPAPAAEIARPDADYARAGVSPKRTVDSKVTLEANLLLLVISAGALGSLVHAATSFATFAGNRQLLHSWLWWFYLRAPIGMMLAVLVYVALRAGVYGDVDVRECSNTYQIALFAGIAGMFSKQVADKLSDLVDYLFIPARQPTRKDSLESEAKEEIAGQPAAAPEEIVRRVQQRLVELGYLASQRPDGSVADDGVLDQRTRDAVEAFLRDRQITESERAATLGEDWDPGFWTKLLDLLETAEKP